MNPDTNLRRALSCLLENTLGAPGDSLEDFSVQLFSFNKKITTVIARNKENVE